MANNIQNSLQQIATDQQARQERNNANAQATAFKLPKGVDSPEDQVLYGYGKVEELDDFVTPADSFNYEYKTGDDLVVITGEKQDAKRGMGEMHVSSQLHHRTFEKANPVHKDYGFDYQHITEVHFSITDKPKRQSILAIIGELNDKGDPDYTLNGKVAYSHTMSGHSTYKEGINTKVEGEYLDGEKHGRWEYQQEAELDYGSATLIVNYKMGEINGEVVFKSTMSEADYDRGRIHEEEDLLEIWKDGVCVDVEDKSAPAKTFFKNILNHATTGGAISNIQNNSRASSMIQDGDAKLLAQLRANTPKNLNISLTAAEAEALKGKPEVKRFAHQPNGG